MLLSYRHIILLIFLFLVQCSAHRLTKAEGTAIGTQNEPNVINERKISYTAYVTLNVGNLEESRNKIKSLIKNYKGFITRNSKKNALVRVPSESFEVFLSELKQLGDVENEEVIGLDITDSYRDNLIKLESLKKIKIKYQDLIAKAVNVQDMLAIEKELERINVEIEKLEGSKRASDMMVQYSSIYIDFNTEKPGPLGWIFYLGYKAIKWLFIWE
ncbi:DUF4349 domain-containing protein [Leptospira interrogans]|uniref:Lipoprotein n=7 Tax=Leptospira interrogans TaxID=173 RepID=Q8F088_LEPIN|nr:MULTISPECIES: DUF4349 domain-containing protein [Leptospira]EMG08789.1 PF14257 domain protein [Leptospira interrogans serovar Grippotyphosa str. LT2186]EMN29717.1 PF14257 domain protein [Leptospira interrogans serovar Pyrogenes str. L0374]EMN70489.1 PF14257 domain protein [Leptospira interrogans serovar Bataviae str. UI 08561]EMP05153.1 PF14257 domain protein [Leptospira interrogans serovar Pyrogenes str. 200701872]KAA1269190.1 DUF4349 domain-containing protein [Leptospira interrogans serov